MLDVRTIDELVGEAQRRLPPAVWDYLAGGAESETTLLRNRAALDRREFRPRVLRDVSAIDLSTELFGRPSALPVFLAPIGSLSLLDPAGAAASAAAASRAGIPMLMSVLAEPSLEVVAPAATAPLVLQLYVRGDDAWIARMIVRAEAAGCAALCLTVDSPVYGRRERDLINRFSSAQVARRANLGETGVLTQIAPEQARLTWATIARVRRMTVLPLVLKGIMNAEDAVLAVEHGVDVVYVSNHGGRQLDHAPATLDLLEEVAAVVAGRCAILVDGGFFSGTDILKAIALGATAVGLGKLQGVGLGAGGAEGLARALEILREEMSVSLALLGCARLADLGRQYVRTTQAVALPSAHRAIARMRAAPRDHVLGGASESAPEISAFVETTPRGSSQ